MKTLALILALAVLGVSPFLWSGSVEAQTRPPQKQDQCKELRLEIEGMETVDISTWPAARILLGLFCAHQGDPRTGTEPRIPQLPPPELDHVAIGMVDGQPGNGDTFR